MIASSMIEGSIKDEISSGKSETQVIFIFIILTIKVMPQI